MAVAKKFHDYTASELVSTNLTVADDPTQNFYVLSSDCARDGRCPIGGKGLEGPYPHMLAALEAQQNRLSDCGPDAFDKARFWAAMLRLEVAIGQIRQQGTDKAVQLRPWSILGAQVGYAVLACGYWSRFVPEAMKVIAAELRDRQRGNIRREIAPQDEEDIAEEHDYLKSELSLVMQLQGETDITRPGFVSEFLGAVKEYSERNCWPNL